MSAAKKTPESPKRPARHSLRAAAGSESAQLKSCLNCKYRNRNFWAAPCATCSMIDIFMDGSPRTLNWLPNVKLTGREQPPVTLPLKPD
jgi:hypothetical protein